MEEAVIGMNLCPWARAADQEGLVSITVCEAREEEEVLQQVSEAIERLLPEECFETALIVTPYTLQSFSDFMDMAAAIDDGALHASCCTPGRFDCADSSGVPASSVARTRHRSAKKPWGKITLASVCSYR